MQLEANINDKNTQPRKALFRTSFVYNIRNNIENYQYPHLISITRNVFNLAADELNDYSYRTWEISKDIVALELSYHGDVGDLHGYICSIACRYNEDDVTNWYKAEDKIANDILYGKSNLRKFRII